MCLQYRQRCRFSMLASHLSPFPTNGATTSITPTKESVMTEIIAPAEGAAPFAVDRPGKEHRGYTPTFALASFGLYFAILTPILGGLSVKLQGLVSIDQVPVQLGIVTAIGSLFALV